MNSTIQIYTDRIKHIIKKSKYTLINDLVNDYEELINIINSYSILTRIKIINALNFYEKNGFINFGENKQNFKSYYKFNYNLYYKNLFHNVPQNKKLKNKILLKDLVKTYNNIKTNNFIEYIEKIIFGLYTLIPPQMLDNINENKDNYLDFNTNCIILNNYSNKIKNNYGQVNIKIPNQLMDYIIESIINYPREYLICKENLKPFGKKNLGIKISNVFNKYFNIPLTVLDLRKIYITDIIDNRNDLIEETSILMRQNKSTQKLNYLKYN
jgi:hypothetical protein